jgi:methyl-accepting chemotaxis protein
MKSLSRQTSFRFKILFVIVSVAFLCISIISTVSYIKTREALKTQSINQFASMGEMIKNRLKNFDSETRVFSQRMGKDRLVEGLFLAYEGAFYGAGLFPGEDLDVQSSQYKELDNVYDKRKISLNKDYSFKNFFLMSLDSQIIMSANKDPKNTYLGRNLNTGVYKDTLLSKCAAKALADTKGELFFSGYEFNKVSNNVHAFYCIKQFAEFDHLSEGIKKGEDMGVVITQVDLDYMSEIVSQRVGMGETGQVYLVGHDQLLRTDLYVNKEKFNKKNSFKNKLKISSDSISKALKGESGNHFITDHNGKKVLSFFSPIKMFNNNWAIVTEIEEAEMFSAVKAMMIFVMTLAVIALVLIIFVGMLVSKRLVVPIVQANEVLGNVASEVNENADKMKSNSETLSDSSTQIASAIQETVSTLDELSSMVNKNLENVELSSKKSQDSKTVAEEGKVSVSNMIGAMSDINTSNQDIVEEMNMISSKMNDIINVIKEIGEKTNVINDIVFQTKLLSFNASVEAARAGEHGKGFAVVAEEVGSLATASGKAATEISEMLDESVKKVDNIVSDTKSKIDSLSSVGQQKVEVGTKTAKECENVLDQILVNVVEVNNKVSEITNASNEQASGIREVTKAMSQLDEMTNSTSTISTEALQSSDILSDESKKLADVVNNLTLLVTGRGDVSTSEELNSSHFEEESETEGKIELIKSERAPEEKAVTKMAVGSNLEVPSGDDDRFEDV